MTRHVRLVYPSPFPDYPGNQELVTGASDKVLEFGVIPQPADLAGALARVSDDWFFEFLKKLRAKSRGRAFAVAAFLQEDGVESSPADVGDFGYDPEDSKRLLELRSAIDDCLGWANDKERERGDYVARVEEVGIYVRALEARFPKTPVADTVGLAHYILNWLESRNGAELEPALEGMTVGDQRRMREELTLILEHGGRPPNWT